MRDKAGSVEFGHGWRLRLGRGSLRALCRQDVHRDRRDCCVSSAPARVALSATATAAAAAAAARRQGREAAPASGPQGRKGPATTSRCGARRAGGDAKRRQAEHCKQGTIWAVAGLAGGPAGGNSCERSPASLLTSVHASAWQARRRLRKAQCADAKRGRRNGTHLLNIYLFQHW